MTVTCPGCKRKLNVPDSAVGKTVTCPACKTPVLVEEELRIMPAADVSAPEASGGIGPAVGAPPTTCPTCGFPVLPSMQVCNRCGTDLATGERDQSRAGYQASPFKKVFARSGWILTLVVGGGLVFGVYMGVTRLGSWAKKEASDLKDGPNRKDGPAAPTPPEVDKHGDAPDPSTPAAGTQAPGRPAAAEASAASPTVAPTKALADRFEEAFALLMDPLPDVRKSGKKLLVSLGPKIAPLVAKRYLEAKEPAVRLEMVALLTRFRTPEASETLTAALGDEDTDVRQTAIIGLASMGRAVSGRVVEAFGADNARARASAVKLTVRLSLKDLVPKVIELLEDPSPEVRWEAAKFLGTRMGTEDAYPNLVAATRDKCLDVALAAADALASHRESLPLVLARFDELGDANPLSRESLVLAVPIFASKDAGALDKLAARVAAKSPLPKVLEKAKRILGSRSTSARMHAISKARSGSDTAYPMPVIVVVSLMDPDPRVKSLAMRYLASLPSDGAALGLIACLDVSDVRLAMSAARALGRLGSDGVAKELGRAVKGVSPQRRVLAAGALAMKEDSSGAEVLKMAATRKLHVESPLPAWAAYQLSSVSEEKEDLAPRFASEASTVRAPLERTYYTAAAARMGDEQALKKLEPSLTDGRTPAHLRVEIAKVLGATDPDAMKKTLLALLRERDVEVQVAALGSLADAGDAEVVPEIMEAMSSLTRVASEAARVAVIRFGKDAEDALQASLAGDDRAACDAAFRILASLGKRASKESVESAIEAMRKHSRDAALRVLAGKALSAMTGRRGKPEWTWAEWSKVAGIRISAPVPTGEQEWGWLSISVPEGWLRRGDTVRRTTAAGNATIRVFTERDPGENEEPLALADRRYKDASAFRTARAVDLATRKIGDQRVPLPNITVKKRSMTTVGSGKARARVAPLFFYNKPSARVSYYLFIVVADKGASWYAEIECSAGENQYKEYQRFFERDLVKALKIDAAKLK